MVCWEWAGSEGEEGGEEGREVGLREDSEGVHEPITQTLSIIY